MTTEWAIDLIENNDENNSDKLFTVPPVTEWELLWIYVSYTSSSAAGNRQLEIQLQSSASNTIAQWQTDIIQPENLTYNYLISSGIPDLSFLRDGEYLTTPMPGNAFLSAGQKIRVWDNNAVDAAADDMGVKIQYGYHEI
jgi:hypothetical protein